MAGAPSTESRGRVAGPALLALGVCGVDGASVASSALGVRRCVPSPLPDRPGDDFRRVAGHGRV